MGKLLVLVLGLTVISFVAWKALSGRSLSGDTGGAEPTGKALDNARGAGKRIEAESEKRAREALEASESP